MNDEDNGDAPGGFKAPTFEFDGLVFETAYGNTALLTALYMAHHARCGDEQAAQLLNALGIVVRTASGDLYWPMEPRGD